MLVILRSAVRMSQLSNREVERRLQWSSGYLSRLFAQDMELKMEHVLCICSAIGFSPAEFLRVSFPKRPGEDPPSWVQALSRLHPVPPPDEPPPAPTRSTAAARSEAASGRPPSKRGRPPEPPPPPPPASGSLSQGDVEKMLLSALRNLLLNPSPPPPPPVKPEDPKPPRRPQS